MHTENLTYRAGWATRPFATSLCFAVAVAGTVASANAATYMVTTIGDGGNGSLRQAITDANAAGGNNTIAFAVPGAGPFKIAIASQLPGIMSTLTIDGYSQSGSSPNTNATDAGGLNAVLQIELAGPSGVYGFYMGKASGVILTVQGLAMHGFLADLLGYSIAGTSQLRSFGNYLCTNLDGSAVAAGPATGSGINSDKTTTYIGGDLASQRNLISGCGGSGVVIGAPTGMRGNFIGTDASGTLAIPNGLAGNNSGITVVGNVANVAIGGATAAARNVISGNRAFGISIYNPYGGAQYVGLEIKGNYIGTDWSGMQPLPNGFADPNAAQYGGGIQLQTGVTNPTPAIIGGFGDGEANLIAYNSGAGIIAASNSPGESFDSRANLLHHNHAVGRANLDIGTVGPTPNDADDADGGSNAQQNWPQIVSASQSGNQLSVAYRVDTATVNAIYPLRIDFYVDAQGGSGQWLGQDSYPAASAQQQRSIVLLVPAGARAFPFVATATDAGGHTSEFSPAFDVIFEDDFD